MKNSTMVLTAIIVFVFLVLFTAFILAWPIQLLWNGCLVGAINGVNPIGFWQAFGIMILAKLLLSSNKIKQNDKND